MTLEGALAGGMSPRVWRAVASSAGVDGLERLLATFGSLRFHLLRLGWVRGVVDLVLPRRRKPRRL